MGDGKMNFPTLQENFGQLCSLVRGRADDLSIGLILIIILLLLWQILLGDPKVR
jgi:hypothetical protein